MRQTENLAVVMKTMGQEDVKTAMQYQHPELEIVRPTGADWFGKGTGDREGACKDLTGHESTDLCKRLKRLGERGGNRTFNLLIKSQSRVQHSMSSN